MLLRTRLSHLLDTAPRDAPALIADERRLTWADLRRAGSELDHSLTELGAGPGARVGVVLENRTGPVTALLGLLASGRRPVIVDPLRPVAAQDATTPPLVILATGTRCAAEIVLTIDDAGRPVPDLLPARRSAMTDGRSPAPPGSTIELTTSGTTGPPRRVTLSGEQLAATLGRAQPAQRGPSRPPSLLAAPAAHISGLWTVLGAAHAGRALVILPRFSAGPWAAAVHRHGVRVAFLVPAALHAVLDAGTDPEALASLELVTTGAGACPPELAARFQDRYGVRVLPTYGATEFAGAVAGWTRKMHERWWPEKAGSCGRALGGTDLRTTSPDGAVLSPGAAGLLEVRGPRSGAGPQTWVRTTDLARIDADGFVWILGRADGAILRGGFTVLPEDVERALERHPAVREAAVTGVPDERLGQVPMAAVVAEPGAEPPTVAALVAHCRRHLRAFEVPVRVLVVDDLPRTSASKVDHRALRAALTP
ncbi:long-chain fatty acid--CoA ligase [Actinomycetes bacterium KLBMP 9759]